MQETLRALLCGHTYHDECILQHCIVTGMDLASLRCPVCKTSSRSAVILDDDTPTGPVEEPPVELVESPLAAVAPAVEEEPPVEEMPAEDGLAAAEDGLAEGEPPVEEEPQVVCAHESECNSAGGQRNGRSIGGIAA
jgi:hypothetical protein